MLAWSRAWLVRLGAIVILVARRDTIFTLQHRAFLNTCASAGLIAMAELGRRHRGLHWRRWRFIGAPLFSFLLALAQLPIDLLVSLNHDPIDCFEPNLNWLFHLACQLRHHLVLLPKHGLYTQQERRLAFGFHPI